MDANAKKALAELEKKHVDSTAAFAAKIEAASKDVREARDMLRDATNKLAQLQRDKLSASFAYDTQRARLEKAEPKAA